MKHLYVVDHAIGFPSSEYGGVFNVIAKNDDECFDLISETHYYESYEECFGKLRENIAKAPRFALVDEEESRIVDSFVT